MPAAQTRKHIYNTLSHGLGGCHAVSRHKIPGGCAAGKPAPQARTHNYITPNHGLGGRTISGRRKKNTKQAKDINFDPARCSSRPKIRGLGMVIIITKTNTSPGSKSPAIIEKNDTHDSNQRRKQNSEFYKVVIKDAQNNETDNVSGQLTEQNDKYARHSGGANKSGSSGIGGSSSVTGSSIFSRPWRRRRLGRHQLRQVHRLRNSI